MKYSDKSGISCVFSEFYFLCDIVVELVDRNSFLLHCIAVTDGHAAVLSAVEVIGDAERSTDLVLTAVTLADGACVVIFDHEIPGKLLKDLFSLFVKLFGKRKNSSLDRSESRMEMKNDAGILIVDLFLVISLAEDCKEQTLNAE